MVQSKNKKIWTKSDLVELVGTNPTHEIYLCPACVHIRGKVDTAGKAYYNTQKEVGLCFKCNTVFSNDRAPSLPDVGKRLLEKYRKPDPVPRAVYSLQWTKAPREIPKVYDYLKSRGITDSLIDEYCIRACEDPVVGVVLPNSRLDDSLTTDFFQIRKIDTDKYKYLNLRGTKPIYGLDFLSPDTKKIIICEGIFSAIAAASIDKNIGSICTYGKSMTEVHLAQLRERKINSCYLMYDGGEFLSIMRTADKLISNNIDTTIVYLPYGEDPDSATLSVVTNSFNNYSLRHNRVTKKILYKAYYNLVDKSSNYRWDYLRSRVNQINRGE